MSSVIPNPPPILMHDSLACEKTADAIRAVSAAAQKLVNGALTRRALALLIRDALPRGSKMDPAEILEVLDAATALGARYTRKVP